MDPHRCYQLKQAYIADLHHQTELARAVRQGRRARQCQPRHRLTAIRVAVTRQVLTCWATRNP